MRHHLFLACLLGGLSGCAGSIVQNSEGDGSVNGSTDVSINGRTGETGSGDGALTVDLGRDGRAPAADAMPGSDATRAADASDDPDRGAPDATPQVDVFVPQPVCPLPAAAPEERPTTAGGDIFVRAGTSQVSFCLLDENTPGLAWGDEQCGELGAGYNWRTQGEPGGSFDEASEAAKAVVDPVELAGISLVGGPSRAYGDALEARAFSVTFSQDWANATGTWIRPESCVPWQDWTAHLMCVKDAQSPVELYLDESEEPQEPDLGIAAVFDLARKGYVVGYSVADDVFLARVDAYGKQPAATVTVSSISGYWGETAKPRVAVSAASRTLVVWQEPAGDYSQVKTRLALFDAAGNALVEPYDFLPFGCYNSRGQHAAAYDAKNDRFLVAANCDGPDGPGLVSLYVQVFDSALTALRAKRQYESKYDETWGFQSTDTMSLAYSPRDGSYLLIDNGERLVLDKDGARMLHERFTSAIGRNPWALVADTDSGGYRVMGSSTATTRGSATQALDSLGAPVGPALDWGRAAGGRLWSSLLYLPKSLSSPFAGKFLAATGGVHLVLNPDGATCYPAMARLFLDDGVEGIVALNRQTGGFARFFRTDRSLAMRVYLSNTDTY
jgi:hypothetical protein